MTRGWAFQEFTSAQRQIYRDTLAHYQAYLAALRQSRAFKGSLHWKKIRGREYLYRYRDRFGHGESLGPRSEQTEKLYADFSGERRQATARLRERRLQLQEQARLCQAARINRVPRPVAKILRRLEQHDMGRNLLVVGAAAIYAYEFAAEVLLPETSGGNLLIDPPRRLSLAGEGKVSWEELFHLLRQADRSMTPVPGAGCLAVGRDGFQVRLLKSEALRPGWLKTVTAPGAREPLPPEAGQLQYLLASPRFSQVIIGADGHPATLAAPDPWAFALNKLWWSEQPERDEASRTRDLNQALAIAGLVLRYLPQYDFSPSELDMFPPDLTPEVEDGTEDLTKAEDLI